MDAVTPFTCILVGQPDLRATLRLKAFEAIYQRVGLRFHLTGLSEAETAAYVAHHLHQAGVAQASLPRPPSSYWPRNRVACRG